MLHLKKYRNWFDIISILILIIVVITHIIDIAEHSEYIARIHISILAIAVIIISMRLLKVKNFQIFFLIIFVKKFTIKVGRVINQEFGMLVMTLYFVLNDIAVWVITYGTFLIPFCKYYLL